MCIWRGAPGWDRELRLLPDGCLDLVWDGEDVLVVPPAPIAVRYRVRPDRPSVGVRIRPGWAALILGVPVGELSGVTHLRDVRRAAVGSPAELAVDRSPAPEVLHAVARLHDPDVEVRTVAAEVGLSPRQLRRRFHDHVGLGPKALQAVFRFRRFHSRIAEPRPAIPLAHIAADCGYWDQSHLVRECRRIAGTTPTALVSG